MFEELSLKLNAALKKVTGQGKLTENNISETLREIRRILLDADVNYIVAKEFIENVKIKSLGKEVLSSISPGQLITKIIYDQLVELLGGGHKEISLNPNGITSILVVGLQGSGKTTFCAKLALRLKNFKRKILLVAADIYRPAAIQQLQILGDQIGIEVYCSDIKDAVKISQDALNFAKEKNYDTVIFDTAGRLHIDEEMMTEVAKIKSTVNPNEILFVVDSMTGQDAVNSAKAFNEIVNFHGIVLTKLDGDSKGGAALSIRYVVQKPIKFISNGEKLSNLDVFYPDRLASRILGKGDVISLVEKAQENIDQLEAKKLEEKLKRNKFDFEDFLKQIRMIKKMGPLSNILSMIPGVGPQIKNSNLDERAIIKVEAIINSMTKQERSTPKILNGSRRKRIARGSGTSIQDVNRLIKQFSEMQRMIITLNKKGFFNQLNKNFNFN